MAKNKKALGAGINGTTAVLDKPKHPKSVSNTLNKLRSSRMAKPNPIQGCTDDAADELDEFPEHPALAEPVTTPLSTPVTPAKTRFQELLDEQAAKLAAAREKAQAAKAATVQAVTSPTAPWLALAFVAFAIFCAGLVFGAGPAVSAVIAGVMLVVIAVVADMCRWIWKASGLTVVKGLVAVGTVIGIYVAIAATFGSYHWGWLLSSLVLYLVARDLKSLAFGREAAR